MATPAWHVSGQYYETCNCDFVCPCVPGQMAVKPTKGSCNFAMAFSVDRGSYGALSLDGLGFIVLGHTPVPGWRRLLGKLLVDEVMELVDNVAIQLVEVPKA